MIDIFDPLNFFNPLNRPDCHIDPAEAINAATDRLWTPPASPRLPGRPATPILPPCAPLTTEGDDRQTQTDRAEAAWWAWYETRKTERRQNARAWACVWAIGAVALAMGLLVWALRPLGGAGVTP